MKKMSVREASHKHISTETPDRIQKSNGWSTLLENEVKNMSELSQAYAWMHFKSARLYKKYNNRITFIILVITTVLMLPNLVNPNDIQEKNTLRVFNVILTIIIAFLSGFNNLRNYAGRSQSHKEAGQQFSRIHDTIRQELLYYRKDRHSANEFVEYQSQILDIYVTGCPDIEDKIVKMFLKKFRGIKINIPNFMNDDIDQFDLISPSENQKSIFSLGSPSKQNKDILPVVSEAGLSSSISQGTQLNVGLEEDEKDIQSDEEDCVVKKHNMPSKLRIELNRLNKN